MGKYFTPFPHQKLAINHMCENDEWLLFAGMGLGKTVSTLEAFTRRYLDGEVKGLLIVAPLRVSVLTWPNEVKEWLNHNWLEVANLRTKAGKQAWLDGSAQIYCINYEALPRFIDDYIRGMKKSDMPANMVVFDESSVAKNPNSKRINHFRRYASKYFDVRGALTGTPLPNTHEDLYAQVRLIDRGKRFGSSFYRFRQEYFEPENNFSQYPKYVLRDGAKELIEGVISDITLTLRSEDYLKIPPTTFNDVEVKLNAESKKIYKKVEKEFLHLLTSGDKIKAINSAVLANKLLQITGGSIYTVDEFDEKTDESEVIHTCKVDALKKLHAERHHAPMLVAANFRHEIEQIVNECGAVEFSEDILDDWDAGNLPMMVAHPKSIGHGLNLQHGGSDIAWFSLPWSREIYDQFNARLARTGQKKETFVFRLVCPDTIDDAVAESLRHKGDNQSGFMGALVNLQQMRQS